jgi:hypothetical protein
LEGRGRFTAGASPVDGVDGIAFNFQDLPVKGCD